MTTKNLKLEKKKLIEIGGKSGIFFKTRYALGKFRQFFVFERFELEI